MSAAASSACCVGAAAWPVLVSRSAGAATVVGDDLVPGGSEALGLPGQHRRVLAAAVDEQQRVAGASAFDVQRGAVGTRVVVVAMAVVVAVGIGLAPSSSVHAARASVVRQTAARGASGGVHRKLRGIGGCGRPATVRLESGSIGES